MVVLSIGISVVLLVAGFLSLRSPANDLATGKPPEPTTTPAPGIHPADGSLRSSAIFPGGIFLDEHNHAAEATRRMQAAGNPKAAALARISSQPTAIWLGDEMPVDSLGPLLAQYVADARQEQKTLVFVLYAIPNRDCGGLSAGGLTTEQYRTWTRKIASALDGTRSVVLVEPDSLAMLSEKQCAAEVRSRPALIRSTVDLLIAAGLSVYLDGGNSHWVAPATMASLLESAGARESRGFFTNVSNFYRVDQERAYAETLSHLLGGKHFVTDVSRNGNGWRGAWCNPSGAALGQAPHVSAGTTHLDALLWVKHPGDSDGTCNGGPRAGVWWERYALDLVANGQK